MDTLKQMVHALVMAYVLGLTHVSVRRAGLEHSVSILNVKVKVCSIMDAQDMVSVARLGLASAWMGGRVLSVRHQSVSLDARMVASVLHHIPVSVQLNGQASNVHYRCVTTNQHLMVHVLGMEHVLHQK